MLYFAIGFISGILAMGFLLIVATRPSRGHWTELSGELHDGLRLRNPKEYWEKFYKVASNEQPEVLEPTPPDVEAMEAVFAENKSKGRDTNISEEL